MDTMTTITTTTGKNNAAKLFFETVAHRGGYVRPGRSRRGEAGRSDRAVRPRPKDEDHGKRYAGSHVLGALEGD